MAEPDSRAGKDTGLAGVVVYLANREEKQGAAIAVGTVVLTALLVVLDTRVRDGVASGPASPSMVPVSAELR
ncbi:hypothetical protein [Streptomyces smyrnaeus]|uniref:hypothetical protein n=1 Tax=Streptomyces smyrnaeus TaxID=1387713 RepID=UPI0036925118